MSSAPHGPADQHAIHTPRRALVTGGAGFIGSRLVEILLEQGVEVRVMVAPGDPAPNLQAFVGQIEQVTGDLLDVASLDRAVAGCDTLFHLAAIYALWLRVPRRMYDVNVDGTRNVMLAARRAGVERIVHTSSIAAVGCRSGEGVADEECRFSEWDLASDYVLSKYVSELEVQRMALDGLPATIVNPAFPFGWGDIGPTPTGKIVQTLLQGMPVYTPGGFNAVGVTDVARGHWLAALHGKVGRRYLLSGDNLTYQEFGQRVARIADVRAPRFRAPVRAFVLAGRLGDWVADHITHKQPLVAETSVRYAAGRFLYFDNTRAREELGYTTAPLDEHIADAVRWFSRSTT